jgi:hypothetical protein
VVLRAEAAAFVPHARLQAAAAGAFRDAFERRAQERAIVFESRVLGVVDSGITSGDISGNISGAANGPDSFVVPCTPTSTPSRRDLPPLKGQPVSHGLLPSGTDVFVPAGAAEDARAAAVRIETEKLLQAKAAAAEAARSAKAEAWAEVRKTMQVEAMEVTQADVVSFPRAVSSSGPRAAVPTGPTIDWTAIGGPSSSTPSAPAAVRAADNGADCNEPIGQQQEATAGRTLRYRGVSYGVY